MPRPPVSPAIVLAALALAACSGKQYVSPTTPSTPPTSAVHTVSGTVLSGSVLINGSTITFYAAGATAEAGATALGEITSDGQGQFNVTLDCSGSLSNAPIYAIATGGTPSGAASNAGSSAASSSESGGSAGGSSSGGGGNTAILLLAAIGPCAGLPSSISVTINELTTVAAGYALDAFIDPTYADPSNADSSSADPGSAEPSSSDAAVARAASGTTAPAVQIAGNATGLANAFATAALLADATSGLPSQSLPQATACAADATTLGCDARAKLGALANALAACVQSSGAESTACLALLDCATPGAVVNDAGGCTAPLASDLPAGVFAPTDTLQAVLSIARNPGTVAVDGLYLLAQPGGVYTDNVAAAPNDWTVALAFEGGGLVEPAGLAIDAAGDVWIADYDNAVTELSPTGAPLSPSGGFAGGGLEESFGIGIDGSGNIWVSNEQSDPTVNEGLGSVTELSPSGAMLSGESGITAGGVDFPVAVLPDASGHVWVANFGDSTLTELSTEEGTALSPDSGYIGGGVAFPVSLALDAAGQVWVANQGANQVSEFAAGGVALSPPGGYAVAGLAVPQSIAVDESDNVWVTNAYGDSVTELTDQGTALSGPHGYTGGGLTSPGGIAIDGAGTVWVANYRGPSITALQGSTGATPGAPLSPATGYSSTSLLLPFALAVDASGDLWVTNFGNDTVTEFIGIAAPVKTPASGPPQAP